MEGSSTHCGRLSTGHAPPRCVVLTSPAGDVPATLIEAMSRRPVTPVIVADAVSVMLQLALSPTAAVIVMDSPQQPHLESLRASVQRYHPGTRLWEYRREGEAGRTRLATLNGVSGSNGHATPGPADSSSAPPPPGSAPAEVPPEGEDDWPEQPEELEEAEPELEEPAFLTDEEPAEAEAPDPPAEDGSSSPAGQARAPAEAPNPLEDLAAQTQPGDEEQAVITAEELSMLLGSVAAEDEEDPPSRS